jgi:meiotically up-regulated gene 157 (Mug157) protein
MSREVIQDKDLSNECAAFAGEVEEAIQQYAVAAHSGFGRIYAYEVDGFGNHLYMDDSNVPSLLALPYIDSSLADDPVYQNTRRFVLSESNPYFFRGKYAEGGGSPHTLDDMIWPLSIIVRAITSQDDEEIKYCLHTLKTTHAGTGFMHESFNKDDPKKFTRKWFAWANTIFGEMILKVHRERPQLLT